MDLIAERRKLKRKATNKPHEKVLVFVQANKDIHDLVEKHLELVSEVVRIEDVIYLDPNKDIDGDRHV